MKNVYVRFYDQENLGDDLFLQVLTDRYLDNFSVRKSHSAGLFTSTNNISIHRETLIFSFIDRVISRALGSRFVLSLQSIRKSDIMVYVGGSLFMETDGPRFWRREKRFYGHVGIPYYILGSNVGPVQTKEFTGILAHIFKNAKDVCFRDRASYEMFKYLDVTRAATDIAFTLNVSKYEVVAEKTAVFSLINGDSRFSSDVTAKYEAEVVNLSRTLVRDGFKVVFMSFCKSEGDEIAIERTMSLVDADIKQSVSSYYYNGDLESALALLARSEMIVASRFHATILGLLFGKKVLPMAYSAKTTNILSDMGFQGPIIDINKINEFDGSAFDFANLQVSSVSDQVKLAEMQFKELDKALTRRQ